VHGALLRYFDFEEVLRAHGVNHHRVLLFSLLGLLFAHVFFLQTLGYETTRPMQT